MPDDLSSHLTKTVALASRPSGSEACNEGGLPAPQRFWSVLVILLALGMVVLDGSLITMALPTIARDLGIAESSIIWLISSYQIAVLCLLLPAASLGDRLGHKRLYLWGIAAFGTAAILCVLAESLWMLVLGRTLQGAFSAAVMTANTVLLRRTYPLSQLGRGISLNALVVGTAAVAGPSFAALMLSVFSWHWLFGITIPLSVLVVWLGLRFLPPDPPPQPHETVRWLDVLLNISMFALLFWGFKVLAEEVAVQGMGAHWLTPGLLMLVGAVVGVVYVRRQRSLHEPLLPLDLLRIPVFALSVGSSLTAFAAQMMGFIALPFLLLVILERGALEAGILVSVWPLASVATAPISGRLIGRYSSATLGGIGMVLFALGLLMLALMPAQVGFWNMAWRLALCGVGFALFQSPNNHTIVTSAPAHRTGAAGGMLSGARLTGQSLGAALAAGIFALFPPTSSALGSPWSFAIATAFALLAAALSMARKSQMQTLRSI